MIEPASSIPEHREHRVRTPDGRTVAACEWGDPDGVAVFALHGTPGGRLAYDADPTIWARHGARRITLDRAGYGASTRHPGRTVADAAADVAAVADALGIDRFAVTGRSGGGPHALACAALLPDRVVRCQAVVSVAPHDAEGLDWTRGMTHGNVVEFEAATAGEAAIRAVVEREGGEILRRLRAGRADYFGDAYEMSESDRVAMAENARRTAACFLDAIGVSFDGWVDDALAFVRPWGFDVASIGVPVYLEYGRDDTLVPRGHGDWLAGRLPAARVLVLEAGHFSAGEVAERDWEWLVRGE